MTYDDLISNNARWVEHCNKLEKRLEELEETLGLCKTAGERASRMLNAVKEARDRYQARVEVLERELAARQ